VLHDGIQSRIRLLVLFVLLGCATTIHAQQQPSHFFLGQKEFEGVQIYDVIQDNRLNYWIATDQGLYRYDSHKFIKKQCAGSTSPSLFGFVANSLGDIFAYNLNNQIIRIKDDSCAVFYELKEQERAADIYLSVSPDDELLVVTKTLLVFNSGGQRLPVAQPRRAYYGFPFVLRSGQTVCHKIATDSVLVYANGKSGYKRLQVKGDSIYGVLKFFRLGQQAMAISTENKQLFEFDETTLTLKALPGTDIYAKREAMRFYNENDQLWIADVISGVRVFTSTKILTQPWYGNYLIADVFKDAEGNLLLSTFHHGIIVIPDLNVPDVLPIPGDKSIVSVAADSSLGILLGTVTGELLVYNNGSYSTLSNSGSRPMHALFNFPDSRYVFFDDGAVKVLDKATRQIQIVSRSSLKDVVKINDTLFYFAMNTGLVRLNIKHDGTFQLFALPDVRMRSYAVTYSPTSKMVYVATSGGVQQVDLNNNVTPLLKNNSPAFANDLCWSNGLLYLAVNGGVEKWKESSYVGLLQPKTVIGAADFLKIDVVDEKIYAITTGGFLILQKDGAVALQLNTAYGFSTNRLYDFEVRSDDFIIGHSKGVQLFDNDLINTSVKPPALAVAEIFVNDSPFVYVTGVELQSDQRKLTFVLSVPTLKYKESIRYHFRLIGYSDKWTVTGYDDHVIVYNALAPGDYTFIVKAENAGVFSKEIVYQFSIAAPFYSRWWFTALVIAAIVAVLVVLFLLRLKAQSKKAKLENELHASRLTAIQSQMNPHFIFNSLNSIQDLVLKGDIDNSYSFITKFSNLVRRTLNYSDKDFIEFEQEIKLLELYLSLEKLRFKEELAYAIDTNEIEDILIPPMLIQPFIENALIHGLLHKEGAKQLKITFELNDHLVCTVEDNGVGRERAREILNRQRADHESFAGNAIKSRFSILSRMYGGELGYRYEDINDTSDSGTRVIITLPVKRKF